MKQTCLCCQSTLLLECLLLYLLCIPWYCVPQTFSTAERRVVRQAGTCDVIAFITSLFCWIFSLHDQHVISSINSGPIRLNFSTSLSLLRDVEICMHNQVQSIKFSSTCFYRSWHYVTYVVTFVCLWPHCRLYVIFPVVQSGQTIFRVGKKENSWRKWPTRLMQSGNVKNYVVVSNPQSAMYNHGLYCDVKWSIIGN